MATTHHGPPDLLQRPNDHPAEWILRKLWNRLHKKNEHFMLAVVGREGIGKSQTAIRIADEIDPQFTADNVIFDVADLLERLSEGEYHRGQVLVLDEAGVSLGRRTWQQRGQVLANQALQLIRSHGVGLIFTLPRLGELDSQAIGRMQGFYEITDKEDGEHVRGKWKWLDPDRTDDTGTVYHKYPRRHRNGTVHRITSIAFEPPREELAEPYKEAKETHQQEFYDEALDELRDEAPDDEEEEASPTDIADEIRPDLSTYIREVNDGAQKVLDKDAIAAEYELSVRDAKQVKSLLLRDVDDPDVM